MDNTTKLTLSAMREIGVIIVQLGQTMVNYAEEIAAQIVTHQQHELTKVGGTGIMGMPQLGLTNLAALGQNNASNQQQANMLMATNIVPTAAAGVGAGPMGTAIPTMNGKSPAKKRKAQGDAGAAAGAQAGGTSSSDAREGHEDKKQRIHWTEEENQLVFKIITENPAKDEKEIIEMLKVALVASNRTPAQFKNHLKNLVKNGKLGVTDSSTYIVNAAHKAAAPSAAAAAATTTPIPTPVATTTTTPAKGAKAEKDKDKAKAVAVAPNATSSGAATTPARSATGKGDDKKDVASTDAGKNGGGRRGGKKASQ